VLLLDRLGVLLMLASAERVSEAEADNVALADRDADGEPVAVPLLVPAAPDTEAQDTKARVSRRWNGSKSNSCDRATGSGSGQRHITAKCQHQLTPSRDPPAN
jgi:hypothetical protein